MRELDPIKATAQAAEAIDLIQRLAPVEAAMSVKDQRFYRRMCEFVAREDLIERISEPRLVWIRDLVKLYVEKR